MAKQHNSGLNYNMTFDKFLKILRDKMIHPVGKIFKIVDSFYRYYFILIPLHHQVIKQIV